MKVIIFAGGVGTRLWPLSRKNSPKQFGKVIGERSALQQGVERLMPGFDAKDIFIATGVQYKQIVEEQLPQIPKENFIYEPALRDVGPAIGLSAFLLDKKFSHEPIAIVWSDHMVKNEEAFRDVLRLGEKLIVDGKSEFVFIGQKPRFANQNCGWIELGEKIGDVKKDSIYKFKKLCYRPKVSEAEEFFLSNKYVWNLGYFVTTPKYLKSLYKNFVPDMYRRLSKIQDAWGTENYESKLGEIYPTLEKTSFDDAILVKLSPENFQVISCDIGWSDVGAWDALKEALTKDKEENITIGDVVLENTKDTLLFDYTKKLCLGIDLNEIIIINTSDVLLVCSKKSVPKIKKFVEKLNGTVYEHLV